MSVTTGSLHFEQVLSDRPASPELRADILAAPGFGVHFTDHMITATWTAESGWHDAVLKPYGPLHMDPASSVLHYGQSIFEGLKAYRHPDGSVWTFRPEANAARFQHSAHRLALPALPVEDFVSSVELLVSTDREWVPSGAEASLYVRPLMFASEAFLGVRPGKVVTYCLIASPAGAYFSKGVHPVSIWLSEEYTRAAPGGTGEAKCAGNYAASLLPQQEAIANGCDQVCFLDAAERRWVEELGGMNLFFVYGDETLVTPTLSGSILDGITRDSILVLADSLGLKVEERRVGVDEWREGVTGGAISEVFACGTAAVITPVGRLAWRGGELTIGGGETGPVAAQVRRTLMDIQQGRAADPYGWMHRIC